MPTYNTRILPVEEWHKLPSDSEPGKAYKSFDKATTNIMVIERDDIIVGSWSLMPYYHAECVWVGKEFRGNPAIIRRLLVGMRTMASVVGTSAVITSAIDDNTRRLIGHLNAKKLPGEHYVIHFGEK